MKKKVTLTILILAILAFGTTYVLAQDIPDETPAPGSVAAFVDADGDGVCDNRDGGRAAYGRQNQNMHNSQSGFVDEDGDGLCAHTDGGGALNQNGFIDADGDGVCDNIGAATQNRAHQHGRGRQGAGQP